MQTLRVNIRYMLEADYCKLAPWAGTDPLLTFEKSQ
jgi:hypothetical protein